jgi:hypothetical protein
MGGAAGTGGAGGSIGGSGGSTNTCMIRPRMGCCFGDFDCSYRCYGSKGCADGNEGMCKEAPPFGQCWGDRDCNGGATCVGANICPCGVQCIIGDKPGNCIVSAVR